MDSFELNKIAGAVIAALLVIVGTRTFIDITTSGHAGHGEEVVGYLLAPPAAPAGGEAASGHGADTAAAAEAAPAAFDAAAVVALVPNASAEGGEKVFKGCKACHSAEQGGGNKVGPALWGLVDRPKGASDGFGYSAAMTEKGGNWGLEELAGFLHNPKEYLPGTKMIYKGVKKDGDLADLLAYLQTLK